MNKKNLFGLGIVALLGMSMPAKANVILFASDVSNEGTSVSFSADLSINNNNHTLTLVLKNTSPESTVYPVDCLSSFYFDIYNGLNRPTLSLVSAIGDTYLVKNNAADVLQATNYNLNASVNDGTWQFKPMNPSLDPYQGFGVGTVGNSNLDPNNFNGNIVNAIDYSIYTGDWTTNNQSLKNKVLVKDQITFTFAGLTGFSEADIGATGVFGLGTGPDALLIAGGPTPGPIPSVPTPTAAVSGLALLAGLGFVSIRRKMDR